MATGGGLLLLLLLPLSLLLIDAPICAPLHNCAKCWDTCRHKQGQHLLLGCLPALKALIV
jgi:hypothetical protein